MSLLIRKAQLEDAEIIAQFNIAMATETENKFLNPAIILAGVRSLFAQPHAGFYLLAEMDGVAAGCLMITTEWSDWRNGLFWWIQSVYIQPEFRRQGIYGKLYERVKLMAREHPEVCGFRLYVEKDNLVAQKTYTTLGMQPTHYLIYEEEC
jgi:ribosomal protein S18 acetylase RimI-like enzyme